MNTHKLLLGMMTAALGIVPIAWSILPAYISPGQFLDSAGGGSAAQSSASAVSASTAFSSAAVQSSSTASQASSRFNIFDFDFELDPFSELFDPQFNDDAISSFSSSQPLVAPASSSAASQEFSFPIPSFPSAPISAPASSVAPVTSTPQSSASADQTGQSSVATQGTSSSSSSSSLGLQDDPTLTVRPAPSLSVDEPGGTVPPPTSQPSQQPVAVSSASAVNPVAPQRRGEDDEQAILTFVRPVSRRLFAASNQSFETLTFEFDLAPPLEDVAVQNTVQNVVRSSAPSVPQNAESVRPAALPESGFASVSALCAFCAVASGLLMYKRRLQNSR